MNKIRFYFSDDLHKFTKKRKVFGCAEFEYQRKSSIKDLVESYNIPHTEIGKILCRNKELGFNYYPKQGDDIYVFGINKPVNVKEETKLRPVAFDEIKFIADANIGKAAVLIRALGYDALWENDIDDSELTQIAYNEDRVVLTRDIDLLKRKIVNHGMYINSSDPFEQTKLVIERFGLKGPFDLFSRCTRCNAKLNKVSKEQIYERLLPKTKLYYNEFFLCPDCEKIYWKGSHREKIIKDFKRYGIII
jgi:uncharacterized protein with PIN domain